MPKKVRILCEGISDKESIEEIMNKEGFEIRAVKFGSKSKLLIKANNYIRNHDEFDIFIIVVDSHCTDPLVTYNEALSYIDTSIINKVQIYVIQHALEAWFLAERNAISRKYRRNFRLIRNPEHICTPDDIL